MNDNQNKTKGMFSNALKKATDLGKKTAEGAKSLAEQTKKNIHDQQAKKYVAVSAELFNDDEFTIPTVIAINNDSDNRKFIEDEDAIGWIEHHKDVPVLHMYESFVKSCGLTFVPIEQRDSVYCAHSFKKGIYVNADKIFEKATQEKLAELSNIACVLGAKSCSVEIVEAKSESSSASIKGGIKSISAALQEKNSSSQKQSGKNLSYFEGHDNPQIPELKWFKHDDNIQWLIEMRCKRAIKSNVLELKGSSSATISKSVACALDDILGSKLNLSMELQAVKECSSVLLFEVEF